MFEEYLIQSVSDGDINTVKMLIDEKGVDVNCHNRFGQRAIIMSAKINDFAIFQFLLKCGADVSVEDQFGHSALTWARRNQNNEMIDLIEKSKNTPKF